VFAQVLRSGLRLIALCVLQIVPLVGPYLVEKGLVTSPDSEFTTAAVKLMQQGLELVSDSEQAMQRIVTYPLAELMSSGMHASPALRLSHACYGRCSCAVLVLH
jgi:hypothetical protein